MGLSSNILWHQTNHDALGEILKSSTMRFAYSLERLMYRRSSICFAYPMISLCDLPFSELGEYLGRYGDCTIGFTREWATDNLFNPVWYCSKYTYPVNHIIRLLDVLKLPKGEGHPLKTVLYNNLAFIKNIEGSLPKRGYKRYRFYDEREYRLTLTPTILSKIKGLYIELFLTEDKYDEYKRINGNCLLDANLSIPFTAADIYCIIVKDENMKQTVQKLLAGLGMTEIILFTETDVMENFIGQNHNTKA